VTESCSPSGSGPPGGSGDKGDTNTEHAPVHQGRWQPDQATRLRGRVILERTPRLPEPRCLTPQDTPKRPIPAYIGSTPALPSRVKPRLPSHHDLETPVHHGQGSLLPAAASRDQLTCVKTDTGSMSRSEGCQSRHVFDRCLPSWCRLLASAESVSCLPFRNRARLRAGCLGPASSAGQLPWCASVARHIVGRAIASRITGWVLVVRTGPVISGSRRG
jgi:hypothetical protein